MQQGRKWFRCASVVWLALALAVTTWNAAGAAPRAARNTRGAASSDAAPRSPRRGHALRQFTGYVSTVDKTSLTVERRGKNPLSRVFVKDEACRTTGEIEKDARVTVYYREEGGKAIAQRVVAKPSRSTAKSG